MLGYALLIIGFGLQVYYFWPGPLPASSNSGDAASLEVLEARPGSMQDRRIYFTIGTRVCIGGLVLLLAHALLKNKLRISRDPGRFVFEDENDPGSTDS